MQHTDKLKLASLKKNIPTAWTLGTSSHDDWRKEIEGGCGQSEVTALLVQEELGGDILCTDTTANGKHSLHYFNLLPDNTLVDIAGAQYPKGTTFDPPVAPASLEQLKNKTTELLESGGADTLRDHLLPPRGQTFQGVKVEELLNPETNPPTPEGEAPSPMQQLLGQYLSSHYLGSSDRAHDRYEIFKKNLEKVKAGKGFALA